MRNSIVQAALSAIALAGSRLGTPSQRLSDRCVTVDESSRFYPRQMRYPFSSAKQHAKQSRQRMVVVNGFEIMNTVKGK